MATPIGNLGSVLYGAVSGASAIREDLADFVANIDPFETPLMVSLPRTETASTFHQWLQDNLRARNTRGIVEGRDWQAPTHVAPTRETNQTEIFGENLGVSKTVMAINPAGFSDFYAYELEKATKSTMIDIEVALMGSATSSTGSSAVGAVMKNLEDFISSTVLTPVDYTGLLGTATRAGIFAAKDINQALNDIWDLGGNTDLLVMAGAYKRQFSELSGAGASVGSSVRNILADEKKLVVGIDVYDSDFGLIPVQLNRHSPVSTNTASATTNASDLSGRIWFLQRSQVRLAYLRPFEHTLMGTRGDSIAGQVTAELTLEVGNEAALGVMQGVNNEF